MNNSALAMCGNSFEDLSMEEMYMIDGGAGSSSSSSSSSSGPIVTLASLVISVIATIIVTETKG
jgi:hypothetical protein